MTLTDAELQTLISALDGLHQPVAVPIQAMPVVLSARAKLTAELQGRRTQPAESDPS